MTHKHLCTTNRKKNSEHQAVVLYLAVGNGLKFAKSAAKSFSGEAQLQMFLLMGEGALQNDLIPLRQADRYENKSKYLISCESFL